MVARADRAGLWRYALPEELGGRGGSNLAMAIVREHLNRLGDRPAQRPAERGLDDRQLPDRDPRPRVRHARPAGAVRARRAAPRGGARVRADRARPRLRRDPSRDDRAPRGRRLGDQRAQALQLGHAPREPRPGLRPHLGLARARRAASPPSSCPATHPGSTSSSCGGRSTCPATTPRCRCATCTSATTRSSASSTSASRSPSASCTRTASARPPRASALPPSASTKPSPTPASGTVWGKPLWQNQGIQFPLAELWTDCELVRGLVRRTAAELDSPPPHGGHPPRRDGQLPRQPPRLRGGRPRDADLRRDRLHAPHALRAHLPPPPPLPHHRGQRGDPDQEGRLRAVQGPAPAAAPVA